MRWLAVSCLFAMSCFKGDPQKCEAACRNYAQLVFWKGADAEIAAAPPDKRDDLRKKKLAEFSANLERGINMCTTQCTSANNDEQIKCMTDAKTADQAKACVKD